MVDSPNTFMALLSVLLLTLMGCASVDCEQEIKEEIIKSGFDSRLISEDKSNGVTWDDIFIEIDEVDNGHSIHLFFDNGEHVYPTIAWLLADVENKSLLDVTIDPENPDTLIFSSDLGNCIRKCYH